MPHRRTIKNGSFGTHFDEVVKHFSHSTPPGGTLRSTNETRAQQEKRDIHALLFERAWRLDREPQDEGAR